MSEAARECKWSCNLLGELGQSKFPDKPVIIFADNHQAIRLSETGAITERSKHIALKYFCCREQVKLGNVSFKYIPSNENLGDAFTKVLCGKKTKDCNKKFGLLEQPR